MRNTGANAASVTAAGLRLNDFPGPGRRLGSLRATPTRDTLHCSPGARGEAVQFNRSVSAMPAHATASSPAPLPGTADTLLVRYVLSA
jgi:hypothetical protein